MRYLLLFVAIALAWPCWAQDWKSAYKVGDAIEMKITDGMWQKGVVTENPPEGMMRVLLEEFVQGTYRRAGGVYIVYGASDIRRAGAGAGAPAPAAPAPAAAPVESPGAGAAPPSAEGHACLNNQPKAMVTRNAAPSTALFQRVIYENYRDKESGRKIGVTFTSWAIATQYRNVLAEGVPRLPQAPVGTMIYRVKTDHHICIQFSDGIQRTDITEGYFLLWKDQAGDWVATPDGKRDSSWPRKI